MKWWLPEVMRWIRFYQTKEIEVGQEKKIMFKKLVLQHSDYGWWQYTIKLKNFESRV